MTHSLSISCRPWIPSSQRHFFFQPSGLVFISCLGCGQVGDLVSLERDTTTLGPAARCWDKALG